MATGGQPDRKVSEPDMRSVSAALVSDSHPETRQLFDAQSLPDIRTLIRPSFTFDSPLGIQKQLSILMLTPWWQFDTYGMSSITRSLVNNLRLVDPDATNIKITCAVLEEEGRIPQDQLRDAEKHKIHLRGAIQPRGKKRKPELQWLDEDVTKYYQDLILENDYNFIIGHIPYGADGVLNLKSLGEKHGQSPKILLVAHALPLTNEREVDEEVLAAWLTEADLILSVGGNVWMQIASCIKAMNIDVNHELYLPGIPTDFANIKPDVQKSEVSGEQNILIMAPDRDNLDISGLDFELAVVSCAQASQNMMFNEGSTLSRQLSFNLRLIATTDDEKTAWEKNFNEIKEKHKIEGRSAGFKFFSPQKLEKLKPQMRRATILVLPLKHDSSLFGAETLHALAAGIPILVSRNSGIASLLQNKGISEPIVWDSEGITKDAEEWKKRLIQKIANPEEAQKIAKELRDILKLDTQTAATHRNFIRYVTDSLCAKIKIELEVEPVAPDRVSAAIKFGVGLERCEKPMEAIKYVVAYLKKLLLSNCEEAETNCEKRKMWMEVLVCLEERKRKVVDVGEDSVTFTLFCPTLDSWKQLHEGAWLQELTVHLQKLMKLLDIEGQLKIRPVEDAGAVDESRLTEWVQQLRIRHRSSEARSDGYETMTVASSVPPFEGLFKDTKVERWLLKPNFSWSRLDASLKYDSVRDHQEYVDFMDMDQALALVGTLHGALKHVPNMNSFTVSNLGTIGISSKPSLYLTDSGGNGPTVARSPALSVMNPGGDQPALILTNDKEFWSPVFVRADERYLAATCSDDNSIHLWDVADGTSNVVYKFQSEMKERKILCAIDERMVACRDVGLPVDGTHRIEILSTDTEQWSLKSVVLINTVKDIYHMCYIQAADGMPCLLLCSPRDHCIQAVEMVGGRVRWESGKNQMNAPLCACTDEEDTVYVADYLQNRLYLLSGEDGSVMSYVDVHQYGFLRPFCLCVLHEYLYVGHLDEKEEKPQISKFT